MPSNLPVLSVQVIKLLVKFQNCATNNTVQFNLFLNLYIYLFIYLWAVLGLHCGERGLLFVAVRGLLIAVAPLCCGARTLGTQASVGVARGL